LVLYWLRLWRRRGRRCWLFTVVDKLRENLLTAPGICQAR
jgi:hypothetical protein